MKIRILHVDDNVHDRKLVKVVLEKEHLGFELVEADSREKFIKYLKEQKFDLVLSDFNILGFDGLQVIQLVQEYDPDLPVIIVTGTGSEEIAIQAMKLGAADYVIKSVKHIQGLGPTIHAVLEHKRNKAEQKKAEDALQLANKRYQRLIESMMDGFAFVDMNGVFTNCNTAFEQMTGYTLSELQELKYSTITPRKWHFLENKIIREQLLQQGFSDVYEKEYIRKDGTIFPVEIRTFLYRNEKGENEGLWAIIRDITLRKRDEEVLKESEANFRELFEFSPVGKSMTGLDGSIKVNNAFCKTLGYTKDEIHSMKWQELTFPEDLAKSENAAQSLIRGVITVARFEKRYIHKQGHLVWTDTSVYLRRDNENNPKFFITTITDISERKKAEEELAFRNVLLTTQMEVAIDGILIVDNNDRIISYNKRFVEMMNIPGELLEQKSDQVLLQYWKQNLDYPDQFLSRVQYLYEHRQESSFDEITLKNGMVIERFSTPMFGNGNHYYGRVWYFRDITVRKNAESRLRESEWKHRIVADNTYDWEFWIDMDGRFMYCSPSCFRITGHTVEAFMEDPSLMVRIVHPDDKDNYQAHVHKAQVDEVPLDLNFRIIHTDGTIRWIGHVCQHIVDSNGNKIGRRGSNRDITAQVLSEEEIRKSEARFRGYFDLSLAGIAITSPAMKWIEVNEYLCVLLGYPREELLQHTWAEFTHPEDIDLDLVQFNRVMKGEIEGYTIDKRFIHKAGRIVWISLSVKCVRHGNGEVDYFMAMLFDISARKQAEESLQKISSELRLIIKNMLNAFIVWESVFDENGNYVSFKFGFFNDSYAMIAKVNQDEVLGRDVFEIWPATEPEWVKVYGEVATSGIPRTFDMYHEPTKGWYHCNAYRPSDSPAMICVIFEDITARRLMEEKLAWEQYLMKTLLDNIPDYIYFKDSNSRFIRINTALAKVFGIENPIMAIGNSDSDYFKTEHSQEAYLDEQKIMETGVPIIGKEEMEVWFDRPATWVSTTKMPLKNTKGEIIGTFGISRDITEKKTIENDLLKAKEKAEESDRLKTAFLQNISHEIRTPLNAIVGFSTILGNSDLPAEKRKEFLNVINASNDQLLSIISGIMALASLETGQEQVAEKETDINELLRNVYDQFSIQIPNPSVVLSYHPGLADTASKIYTDPVKLMQILINLVGNALKFTEKGYVKFGYTMVDKNLQFFVEDSGIGIAPELHEIIFERFRQADNSATRKYGGTGLGLALSKGYVNLLRGTISLTSNPGVGSTFSFAISYKPVTPAMISVSEVTTGLEEMATDKTILVAEDDNYNFRLVEEMLGLLKIKVIRAVNGWEAVNICMGTVPPDVVLMDIKMPVMDGIEATKSIKSSHPGIPIIALTAYTSENDKMLFFASGCDGFLEKPIREKDLYAVLSKYL